MRSIREHMQSERRGRQRLDLGGMFTFSTCAEAERLMNKRAPGLSSTAQRPLHHQSDIIPVTSLSLSSDIQIDVDIDVDIQRQIYFKELAHMIIEAGKIKICRVEWQAEDPGKNQYCSSSPKAVCWQNSLLLRGDQVFYLFRPSTD